MRKKFGRQIGRMAKMTLGVCLAASMVVGSVGSGAVPYIGMVEDVYAGDELTYMVGESTYKYVVNDNGETCEITGYEGSDTEIKIPDEIDGKSVTIIGESAFDDCSSLTSIEIPSSVTQIGIGLFKGCSSLSSIKVDKENEKYDSRENCNGIIETSSNTLICGISNTKIPASVTSIRDGAFEGCSSLTSIEIPSGVTRIGDMVFVGCSSLTSIELPSSVNAQ